MSLTKKKWVIALYIIVAAIAIGLNSALVVDWLNKSMFIDYTIVNKSEINESFNHGASLIFLITILIYAILGSTAMSIVVTDGLMVGLVIANHIKVEQRNEFITYSDLRTVATPGELLSFINISFRTAALFIIAAFMLFVLLQWLARKLLKRLDLWPNGKSRITLFLISLLCLSAICVKPNAYNAYILKYKEPHLHNWDPMYRAHRDGFVPSFIHTMKPNYMDKPSSYKKENLLEISRKYKDVAKDKNEKRNKSLNDSQTILYLSESLMDPKQLPDLLLNETPIPYISKMAREHIGGTMYSPYIGGGTANVEWSILTSFSLEDFREPLIVTPYADFFAGSRNHNTVLSYYDRQKVAIHPYTAELYNRKTVYNVMGFDEFLYLNHGIKYTKKLGTHHRISDESLTEEVLEMVAEKNPGLIHVLSMQNHVPYDGTIPEMGYQPKINLNVYPKEKRKELINYLQGIHASDKAIETMIKKLKASRQEVNIVFYGDHLPGVFTGMEDRFGTDKLHETPWFIYMNHVRSQGGQHLEGLSPAFIVPALLQEGNYRLSAFHSLMDELLSKGVKRIGMDYVVTEKGKVPNYELPNDLREMIHDYHLIEYDALFGNHWLGDTFFSEIKS
ncbi:LTA synthase family protein [Aciduricibacillus chroicocephali]|uniref:LTA synthase family protein n=1 Tax=Aciduricibacillus chroicocephali TaxID=3054939 RepID=A0ABY9KXI1_9BACI|nr:LTA synthase family protein [Bacillaceae bacterium 44XB]